MNECLHANTVLTALQCLSHVPENSNTLIRTMNKEGRSGRSAPGVVVVVGNGRKFMDLYVSQREGGVVYAYTCLQS